MGASLHRPQVTPALSLTSPSALLAQPSEVSRASFHFLRKVATSGSQEESTWWLASSISCPQETFFVRQISKTQYQPTYPGFTTTNAWRPCWRKCDC
jgi:hypothetical protein